MTINSVGVKVHQSTVGLGIHAGPNHDKKCGHGQRAFSPALLGRARPGLLKRRPRRNVSSDASNRNPTHTLHIVGNRPQSKESAERTGGQPQLPH